MLRAFVDDSQAHQPPKVMFLAGYLAPSDAWAKFSMAWSEILEMKPAIKYFRFREAENLDGQFRHWSEARRDEKVMLLRRVIEEHIPAEFALGLRTEAFQAAFGKFSGHYANPYYFMTAVLLTEVARNLEKFGLPRGPVQFVFDNQFMEQERVLQAWEWAKSVANPNPPDLLSHTLVSNPVFRDSKATKPIQAADMHAGWLRRTFHQRLLGQTPREIQGFRKNLRGMIIQYSEEELRAIAKRDKEDFFRRPDFYKTDPTAR